MHCDPVPYDLYTFFRHSVLLQKLSGGFGALNLEWGSPLVTVGQAEVVQDTSEIEKFFIKVTVQGAGNKEPQRKVRTE